MKQDTIFVYMTYPTQEAAGKVARMLLEQRLIACSNVIQSISMYWWEGKIEQADEWVMIAKTIERRFDDIVGAVKKYHHYQVPCIVKVPVQAEQAFGEWLEKCV
jgi:periplasmic divalent cation tolerance protein